MFLRNKGTGSFQDISWVYYFGEPQRTANFRGADFPRKVQQDGSEGETHKEEVEKKYFPETQTADFSLKLRPFGGRVLKFEGCLQDA